MSENDRNLLASETEQETGGDSKQQFKGSRGHKLSGRAVGVNEDAVTPRLRPGRFQFGYLDASRSQAAWPMNGPYWISRTKFTQEPEIG